MYKLVIPIHLKENTDKYEVLEILESAGADCAVLAFDNIILSAEREKYESVLSAAKDMILFLKSCGYAVGIWFWSLWLGDIDNDTLPREVMISPSGKPRIAKTALNSTEKRISGYICPTSSKINIMLDIIRFAASLAPDLILLNDDLGYSTYLGGLGCYCSRHMKMIEEECGRTFTREELREAVCFGKRNSIRDKWLEINGRSLEKYAGQVREAIDSVDPSIRCGFCCVMSNWTSDGCSVEKIAKLMAGNSRPLIRLIGAPYWAASKAWGNRLQHTVELIRMETAWIEDSDTELISEGDVYPRPRHRVPSSFLESYDTALRAAGCCDGIFKLMLDYNSSLKYETGYLSRHIANKETYSQISQMFDGKSEVGVRVYESLNKAADADFSDISDPEKYASDLFFSYATRFLCDNTLPTRYRGNDGVGIAFGENARALPSEALENGLIIDIRAARILMEQGIDVGIERIGNAIQNNMLYFPDQNEQVLAHYGEKVAYKIIPKKNARIVTYSLGASQKYADAFLYENANKQRFLVYAFDAAFTSENRYRNYSTQKQLADAVEWLGGKKLPARCLGNPDLYMICKRNKNSLSIGLWNLFADDIPAPEIVLGERYRSARFVCCEGELCKDTVKLSGIAPYGHAFIELEL